MRNTNGNTSLLHTECENKRTTPSNDNATSHLWLNVYLCNNHATYEDEVNNRLKVITCNATMVEVTYRLVLLFVLSFVMF
jgi:monomeric isocitrate dehydrogenase